MKMKDFLMPLLFFCTAILTFAQNNANLTFRNYINTEMTVFIESYDNKGNLKVNESQVVDKATINNTTNNTNTITPVVKKITVKAYKGGNIKIKYSPTESNTKYNLDPIQIPNANNDVNQTIPLSGLTLYNPNDNKERLLSIGKNLKFDSNTELSRLIDVKRQLGSLIIGNKENGKLIIRDVIPLKDIDITYDKTSLLQETSVTEKSIVSQLKVAVPIYGSIESLMSNSDLHQVKWEISYYPFISNTSFAQLVNDLDLNEKKALIGKLKLVKSTDKIYLLRNFDVIESGIFSVTSGLRVNTEGNAAIASVFTANAAYAFRSEDSKFISIPNKAYNLKYEEWLTVNELITGMNIQTSSQIPLPTEGRGELKVLSPIISNK